MEDIFKEENYLVIKHISVILFMLTSNGLALASGANKSPKQEKNFCKGHIILYSLTHENIFLGTLVVSNLNDFNASYLLM